MTTTTSKSMSRNATLVGAGLGLVLFLAVGLLPTVLYGGYAGVILASALHGGAVSASFAVNALIVVGMVLAVALVAALFAAAGAVAGAAVGVLASGATRTGRSGEHRA